MDGFLPLATASDATSTATISPPDASGDPREALVELVVEARRHPVGLPAELLAAHALRVTAGADFAVAEDALAALVRRGQAARRDRLAILKRPAGRVARGWYRVGHGGRGGRTYDVWLEVLDPPAGSCSCPDYAKASLGLCKHIMVVLAATARGREATRLPRTDGPRLRWDPIRPLTGRGDALDRIRWHGGGEARGAAEARMRQLFGRGSGAQPLRATWTEDPRRRLHLVDALLAWALRSASPVPPAEPALLPLLRSERDRLRRIAGVEPRALAGRLATMKRKLFPYQREGVRRFLEQGRLLLADDMGLGKTAQAIAACHVLFAAGKVERALIVVPAALKPQWEREWQGFTDLPITVLDGSPAERARTLRRHRRGALLCGYEQVVRDLPLVLRLAPELVVLDEAQRIKNWETKTAAAVKRLDATWRLVLTGTPMENRLEELASILEWIDEAALEPRWRLASWHTVRADGAREVVGARNLETLRTRLAPCLLRRVRAEVLSQLPPRRDTRVPVPLTDEQQTAHDDLVDPIVSLMARARKRPLTQAEFLRLMGLLTQQRILCNGIAQRDFEEVWPDLASARRPTPALLAGLQSPKLLELRELVSGLVVGQAQKVVVFSQWRRMLRLADWAVSDLLAAGGLRSAFFSGEESQRRRTQNLVDFHDDPATRILFATDAGGVGLNLQRAASSIINLDLPWNPAVLEQRIGRIYRLGQESPVEVYNLVAESGIEARIAAIVSDKKALFRGLFDGSSDEVAFERAGSFMARLERLVDRPEIDDAMDAGAETDLEQEVEAAEVPAAGVPPLAGGLAVSPDPIGAGPSGSPSPAVRGEMTDLASLRGLLGQLSVTALPGGRVAIEAPAATAALVAGFLRSLADGLEFRA